MKDPAFLFYPGDYLRDTQCLSEAVQVAYDRIMCEHMRNICISQQQLNFFTKRLTDDQKSELAQVLTQITGGFQISWVAESIEKRRNYSESRRNNRKGSKKHMSNISKTYDSHMENENENENENRNGNNTSFGKSENLFLKIKDFAVEIENSYSKIEAAARRNKTSPDVIKSMIPDFVDVCITKSKDEDTWYNYCDYFSNWLSNEFSRQKKSTQTKSHHQLREMNYNEKP